ncbi:amidohydrolase family protein [Homoserinibacter sp. GY 40078]|nr:amidohydrolase family protein [Homoserinibacter sp. GY 40078]
MPDLVLRGARLPRLDGECDVLLRGGEIAEIAPRGRIAEGGARSVELGGRLLLPGLWDEHVHFTQHVIRRRRLDLADTTSPAEVLDRLRAELARRTDLDAGELIMGYGFRDGLWTESPTLAAIDDVSRTVPVALVSADLHCAWVNTPAARLLELEPDASGVVREGPWIAASARLEAANAVPISAYRDAAEAAARRGVVGIVDYEYADNVAEWRERVREGVDQLRVDVAVWPDRLDEALAAGHRTGDLLEPSGLIRMGRLKVVVDGSLNTRTAWCWDPYPGAEPTADDAYGVVSTSAAELRRLLAHARGGEIGAAVHAIGDHATTEVLDAFEELGMSGIVEHAQLISDRDLPRFARLGLVASVQPEHAMDDRDVAEHHWLGRTGRAFAFGSLHAAGAELRLGSDAPVAPLDPWISMSAAISRSRGDRDAWHPEQRLPFEVAFAASTRGRTTVAVGDPADLVVVESDPATLPRDALRELPVAATLVGGRATWSGTLLD